MVSIPDEKAKKKLKIAQGNAFSDSLNYLSEIVEYSESSETDDYIVTLAAEEAEGLYYFSDKDSGSLSWHPPGKDANQHLEVVVQDKDDKRFLPNLEIQVELFDETGSS